MMFFSMGVKEKKNIKFRYVILELFRLKYVKERKIIKFIF